MVDPKPNPPTLGDQVRWLTHPELKGPHRYTFGIVVDIDDDVVWEIELPDESHRFVVPHILAKVPGRHVSK